MTKRMLIDATHEEETRVAISDGNKLVEYDYESSSRKPIKGNIYLAKVTRVEPSLQAAFVNFGGNRHGFLPFSEIHPDYFRIPVSDREALMAEQEEYLRVQEEREARIEREEAAAALAEQEALSGQGYSGDEFSASEDDLVEDDVMEIGGAVASFEDDEDETLQDAPRSVELLVREEQESVPAQALDVSAQFVVYDDAEAEAENDTQSEEGVESAEDFVEGDDVGVETEEATDDSLSEVGQDNALEGGDAGQRSEGRGRRFNGRGRNGRGRNGGRQSFRHKNPEMVGGEEEGGGGDEEQRFRFNLRRKYKIQEVIKRGQIMLVQASKEERGNKGAALGTYLSLPGRYCVLMPNSPRAGGVSRKIANFKDRARMREIMRDLEVPKGMSVIVRTAGVTRTKVEIKRDLDYLLRLWDNIRDLTLKSTAPAIVYEEADLIKRAVRDLYTREVEEIIVSGETGFHVAKNFMKMMMPSHVKKVVHYEDQQIPMFNRYQIESQIAEIGQPEVRLRSGGYLVINPTEALVSIDVNSGKATKGRHIEETALKTNLEAADEVARQLRLRDLGGLVVIDFIDMEDRRNNAKVERRLKEALSTDRARVQVGRISSFGLLELSRQRLSPSLTEAQFEKCTHCLGLGLVRTPDAMSIIVLRAIEEEGLRARAAQVTVHVTTEVALYILNYKRRNLAEIEQRYSFEILIRVDDHIAQSEFRVEVSRPIDDSEEGGEGASADRVTASATMPEDDDLDTASEERFERGESDDGDGRGRGRRRGRRGGRGRRRPEGENAQQSDSSSVAQEGFVAEEIDGESVSQSVEAVSESQEDGRKNPRRGRGRGGRTRGDSRSEASSAEGAVHEIQVAENVSEQRLESSAEVVQQEDVPHKAPARGRRKVKINDNPETQSEGQQQEAPSQGAVITVAARPVRAVSTEVSTEPKEYEIVNQPPKEKKRGWWNKLVE